MDIDFPRINKLLPHEIQNLKVESTKDVVVGFGEYGEGYVRFYLIENGHRIRQAVRNIKKFITPKEKIHAIG